MSVGNIVGGVLGGIIGLLITWNPYGVILGISIGMGVGGFIDPLQTGLGKPQLGALSVNTAEEGIPLPDLLGMSKISGNIIWYGGWMSDYSEGEIQGNKYYMSWMVMICEGQIDDCRAVYRNEQIVQNGPFISADAPDGMQFAIGTADAQSDVDMGLATIYFGSPTQLPLPLPYDDYGHDLAFDFRDNHLNPPYKNMCYVFFGHCYMGQSNNAPSMSFVVRKCPVIDELSPGSETIWTLDTQESSGYNINAPNAVGDSESVPFDYNPAHAIWYIFTRLLGLSADYLDTTSFESVAATMVEDNFGISVLMNQQQTALSYIESILVHIDGVLVYGIDGKWHLRLLRDDIATSAMMTVTEEMLLEPLTFNRPSWFDTVNEIKIQYPQRFYDIGQSWRGEPEYPLNFQDSIVATRDIANIEIQGRVNSQTIQFPLVTSSARAAVIADRELRRKSYPYATIQFKINREGFRLEPGDVFLLTYPLYDITEVVFRVVKVMEENEISEKITVDAVEDFYYYSSENAVSTPILTPVTPGGEAPLNATEGTVEEAPPI